MNNICNDDRFIIIERAKKDLLEKTNVDVNEYQSLSSFMYKCWQMDWLDKYRGSCVENERVWRKVI